MTFFSTRLLLTCAAIGVGGGLVFGIVGYLHPVVLVTVPILYGALIGVYFFPGVVAQSLLRRGGVALLTGTIAGLAASAVDPANLWRHVGVGVLIGALQELPFALSGYRYWRGWVFGLAAVVAGLVMGAFVLVLVGPDHFAPLAETVYIALFVLSPLLVTWLARRVSDGIDSTGAARGIQGEIDRRRRGAGATPLAMVAA
ncbi:ECF transporter S component [Labedella populi]|nr:ECF transporter S component [Labedella populi]